mgnify:CR=1 FL=1
MREQVKALMREHWRAALILEPERRAILANRLANRAKTSGSPCAGVNPADVRADVRATPDVVVATRDVALQRLTDASEKAGLEP